ncbi:hypothetical protein JOF56_007459 [Kibdelosporangium banguiense]|uniref:Uncharacterized protein n=1 Tax=Kibdelosporangium banguiense TaxID=1365924 RepID=A0ABS4TRP8_9PSEU|nr:hypothetical protein [Kibdelosporangium banguiense]MBP2327074.1 hypothetical protein [Kibdelosporangium banguiense]
MKHQLVPVPAMDRAFPWRSPRDPMNRVYEPFADAHGRVHPRIVARADEITALMLRNRSTLKAMVRDPDEHRLPDTVTNKQLEAMWPVLEQSVAAEIRRLTRGEALKSPPVRIALVERKHVPRHERVLVGQWGLFLAQWPPNRSASRRPSLLNGRILGVYLGAVLDDPDDLDFWEKTYQRYPAYALGLGEDTRYESLMGAEGAANAAVFANTATKLVDKPDGHGQEFAIDEQRVNAMFLEFVVRMPLAEGGFKPQIIGAVVALENAFDEKANPYGSIMVDYGETYLPNLNKGP